MLKSTQSAAFPEVTEPVKDINHDPKGHLLSLLSEALKRLPCSENLNPNGSESHDKIHHNIFSDLDRTTEDGIDMIMETANSYHSSNLTKINVTGNKNDEMSPSMSLNNKDIMNVQSDSLLASSTFLTEQQSKSNPSNQSRVIFI